MRKTLNFFLRFGVVSTVLSFRISGNFSTASSLRTWGNFPSFGVQDFGQFSAIPQFRHSPVPALSAPFPVRCLKSTSWKVATDQITYLLQSHLQFPHECYRKCLVTAEVLGEFQGTRFDQLQTPVVCFIWRAGIRTTRPLDNQPQTTSPQSLGFFHKRAVLFTMRCPHKRLFEVEIIFCRTEFPWTCKVSFSLSRGTINGMNFFKTLVDIIFN